MEQGCCSAERLTRRFASGVTFPPGSIAAHHVLAETLDLIGSGLKVTAAQACFAVTHLALPTR